MLDLLAAGAEHAEPSAFGIAPSGYVALSMLVVFAIMLWMRVPRLIAGALDKKIAGIREQLDTAAKLRDEAAALRAEYEAKSKAADAEIAALKAAAEKQAADVVAKAKQHAADLIARHKTLSEAKIAAADEKLVDQVIGGL
jgi:F-type H+-transporting ATPase subunit b